MAKKLKHTITSVEMALRIFLVVVVVSILSTNGLPIESSEETRAAQEALCAITKLENTLKDLPYVELQPCSPTGVSCVPENSDDLVTQTNIVYSYAEYIVEERISDNYAFPDHLSEVLDVINATLPTFHGNETFREQPTSVFQPNVPVCVSDVTFQSNCTVHLLNTSLNHLIALYRYTLPTCSFCKSIPESIWREVNETFFNDDYLNQLLPSKCRILFILVQPDQSQECMSNPYVLYQHLTDLTMWMDETLPLLNSSTRNLELLVEKLNTTILPSVADTLDGLKQEDSCAGETRSACLRLKRQEVIQIAQGFATCDSLSEPRMAMASTIQLFELMRINFVYLFRHLSIL